MTVHLCEGACGYRAHWYIAHAVNMSTFRQTSVQDLGGPRSTTGIPAVSCPSHPLTLTVRESSASQSRTNVSHTHSFVPRFIPRHRLATLASFISLTCILPLRITRTRCHRPLASRRRQCEALLSSATDKLQSARLYVLFLI